MKRILLTFAVLGAFALSALAQQRRLVLIEEFTNTGCGPCATWSPILDAAIDYRLGDCIAIKYHSKFPYNDDEFYLYDPGAQQARVDYYNVTGVPATFVDGIELTDRTFDYLNQAISYMQQQPSPGELSVSKQLGSNHVLKVEARFTPHSDLEGTSLRLFVAVVEEHLKAPAPYPNGETELNYTMRKLMTGGGGHDMGATLAAGQAYTYNGQWTVDFMKDEHQMGVVAFVQDLSTRQVLATAYIGPEAEGEDRMALMSVDNTPDLICTPAYHGRVLFRNDGAGTVSSATLNVSVNGQLKQYPWTGNLSYLERDTMVFSDMTNFLLATDGKNQAKLWLSDINGNSSARSNSLSLSFGNAVQARGQVQLRIYTDKKPEETSWTLYNSAGDIVQQGGPYTEARKFMTETLNLAEDDCYHLELLDAGGDGIKGASGNGYYQLFQIDAQGKSTRLVQGDYDGAVCDVFFRLNGSPASEPLVLFEEFTNTGCDPCAEFSPSFDRVISERRNEMVPITYHINFPSPRDPFYLANPEAAMARANYYGVTGVPSLRVMGQHAGSYGFENQLDSYIDISRQMETKVRVSTEAVLKDNQTVGVRATLVPLADTNGSHLRLFVVAVEERIEWAEPAPNGESTWNYVMRSMLPSASGQQLPALMEAATPLSYDYTVSTDNLTDPQELGMVCFVQDTQSGEVVGTCYLPRPTGDRRAAKILEVVDAPDRICQPLFATGLVVRNTGKQTLTSAVLNVSVNGSLQQTPWTGTLRPLQTDTLRTPPFTAFELADGQTNSVELWLSDLNGSDQQSVHRQLTLNNAFAAQNAVRLTLMTDNAPEEITWQVTNSAGDVVCQGGPYTEARKRQVTDLPLGVDDCYTLLLLDSGGNGITGASGRGYYMLHEVSADGKTRLLTQADYTGASHEVYFSLQNANSDGIDAIGRVAHDQQPDGQGYTPAGQPASKHSHLIIYKDKKVITNK